MKGEEDLYSFKLCDVASYHPAVLLPGPSPTIRLPLRI